MSRVVAVICFLTFLTAGCTNSTPVNPTMGDSVFGPSSGLTDSRGDRSLDETPSYALGEWWRYQIQLDNWGESAEITVVVAGATKEFYLFGHAIEDSPVAALNIHAPALGIVSKTDLSYDAHDRMFKLLEFPLKEGRSWSGQWYGNHQPEVHVVETTEHTATILASGPNPFSRVEMVYDAELGAIKEYGMRTKSGERFAGFSLLDHGMNYEGTVRVPLDMDLIFCHGRLAVGLNLCGTTEPATPSGEVDVPDMYDRGAFSLIANAGWTEGDSTQTAYVDVTAVDPSGVERSIELRPGARGQVLLFEMEEFAGTWTYEVTAAGGGTVPATGVNDDSNAPAHGLLEGVAYRVADVRLPEGCLESEPLEDWPGQPC